MKTNKTSLAVLSIIAAWTATTFLCRAQPSTADSLDPFVSGNVSSMAVQVDGKILLGGSQPPRIARVQADGTVAPALNPPAGNRFIA
jgi:hypothetical protein